MRWLAPHACVVLAAISGIYVHAHSGGLDSNGCHSGSQPYHCHRAPSEMVGNRLRCDLGSRSKECLGYGSSFQGGLAEQDQKSTDVVAKALWDAAEREPDPDIKARLLDEYYRLVGTD